MHAAAVLAGALVLLALLAAAQDANCAPASCGNLTIRYPFWVRGQQPSDCGYPSFGVACDRTGAPPLLNDSFLRLLDINYGNSSVLAYHSSIARDPTGCRGASNFNVSVILALSLLTISRANQELFLCGNCSRRPPADWLQMNCTGYAGGPWFVHLSHEPGAADHEISSAGCQCTAMPVMPGSELRASGDYAGL